MVGAAGCAGARCWSALLVYAVMRMSRRLGRPAGRGVIRDARRRSPRRATRPLDVDRPATPTAQRADQRVDTRHRWRPPPERAVPTAGELGAHHVDAPTTIYNPYATPDHVSGLPDTSEPTAHTGDRQRRGEHTVTGASHEATSRQCRVPNVGAMHSAEARGRRRARHGRAPVRRGAAGPRHRRRPGGSPSSPRRPTPPTTASG